MKRALNSSSSVPNAASDEINPAPAVAFIGKKVLVGVEASDDAGEVLEAAVEQMANEHRADLVIVYVEPLLDARDIFDPQGIDRQADPVAELELSFPQLSGRIRRVTGEPVMAICAAAAEEKADLILIGSSFRRRRFLGTSGSRIARFASCPVRAVDEKRAG
ncbi:MAG: universal stress protein [Actinomycetota bacterium]